MKHCSSAIHVISQQQVLKVLKVLKCRRAAVLLLLCSCRG
jgi:hypothetical protein